MKQVNQVGVDVDSEALVCAMQRAGQRLPLARFANCALPFTQAAACPSLGRLVSETVRRRKDEQHVGDKESEKDRQKDFDRLLHTTQVEHQQQQHQSDLGGELDSL